MAKAATWAKRVEAWRASGLSAAEFSDGTDFTAGTLRWWSSRLGRAASVRPRFPLARVVRRSPGDAAPRDCAILVEIAGARVFVPRGVDRDTLLIVLDALQVHSRDATR